MRPFVAQVWKNKDRFKIYGSICTTDINGVYVTAQLLRNWCYLSENGGHTHVVNKVD